MVEAQKPKKNRLPTGMKHTDLGPIPEDWEIKNLGEVYLISAGGDFDISRSSKIKSEKYKYDIYSNGITNRGLYGYADYASYKKDSITITARGTLGVANYRANPFTAIGRVLVLEKKQNICSEFVTEYINNKVHFVTETTGVPQLTAPQIAKYQIPLPQPEEQKAIAGVLSDVDELIAGLERLIAKKRAVKTATMQQLLTGRTRLPGFTGQWEEKTFGELCEIVSGGTPSTNVPNFWMNGTIPWCTPSDITKEKGKYLKRTERSITPEGLSKSSANLLPKGALLLCSRATIGEVKISLSEICTNQGFKSLICKNVDNEFMYYKILTIKNDLLSFSIGSTFLEFSRKDLSNLLIQIPSRKEEQAAIASILSDMDAEIAALEKRLAKTRDLKAGMMQELLTGRTRLIDRQKLGVAA